MTYYRTATWKTTMTMSHIIQLPKGSVKSTRATVGAERAEVIVTSNVTTFVISSCNQYKSTVSPLTGRRSRRELVAEKVAVDPVYAARMEYARSLLAEDMVELAGETMASLRMRRGFSQTALAKKIGTSQAHIARIEGGQLSLKWDTVTRLADALEVSTDSLRRYIGIAPTEVKSVLPEMVLEL